MLLDPWVWRLPPITVKQGVGSLHNFSLAREHHLDLHVAALCVKPLADKYSAILSQGTGALAGQSWQFAEPPRLKGLPCGGKSDSAQRFLRVSISKDIRHLTQIRREQGNCQKRSALHEALFLARNIVNKSLDSLRVERMASVWSVLAKPAIAGEWFQVRQNAKVERDAHWGLAHPDDDLQGKGVGLRFLTRGILRRQFLASSCPR